MPFPATVFNVLIASPSDVPDEREAIAAALHSWNALNAKETGKVLLPVMWESHSAPSMSDRAQGVINNQLVRNCDMLIGAFWTRLGSPTGQEISGTVEEIKWFLKQKKPVMLYFSKKPVDPDELNMEQWEGLKTFKKDLMSKGLLEQYTSVIELNHKLTRQLTIVMRDMSVSPVVDSRAIKRAIASEEETAEASLKAPQVDRSLPADAFLEEYTDRSFLVRGNTLEYKDAMKELGGSWIKPKSGDRTWCFSKKKLKAVADLLGISEEIRPSSNP